MPVTIDDYPSIQDDFNPNMKIKISSAPREVGIGAAGLFVRLITIIFFDTNIITGSVRIQGDSFIVVPSVFQKVLAF